MSVNGNGCNYFLSNSYKSKNHKRSLQVVAIDTSTCVNYKFSMNKILSKHTNVHCGEGQGGRRKENLGFLWHHSLLLDTLSWHIVMSVNIHHVQNMFKPSYIRLGKTGSLGPWSRVMVCCSKLCFCQNDPPIAQRCVLPVSFPVDLLSWQ